MGRCLLIVVALGVPSASLGQSSASYQLEEHVFNAGGRPENAEVSASASHRISLDALGGAIAGSSESGSHRLDAGFVPVFRPPSVVQRLVFLDETSIAWANDPSVGIYNLYRGDVAVLDGVDYGACDQADLLQAAATVVTTAPAGRSDFYLATAENRIEEEATLGFDSSGTQRLNGQPCP